MAQESPWAWAVVLALPICCGGWALFGAGGLAALGALAAWQGLVALATTALLAAAIIIIVRRRSQNEST